MIIKLKRTQSTAEQNKDLKRKPRKLWEQQEIVIQKEYNQRLIRIIPHILRTDPYILEDTSGPSLSAIPGHQLPQINVLHQKGKITKIRNSKGSDEQLAIIGTSHTVSGSQKHWCQHNKCFDDHPQCMAHIRQHYY